MKFRFFACLLPLLLVSATSALADAPAVTADSNTFIPNAAGQVISLHISGSDVIGGEDLKFQINDGTFGPLITSVDILTGTIFDPNNTGENGGHGPTGVFTSGPYAGRLAILSTTTLADAIIDDGLLARVTIDTTNFNDFSFRLNLLGTHGGNSDLIAYPSLAEITPSFTNNLFIAPEPSSLAILATATLMLALRRQTRCARS